MERNETATATDLDRSKRFLQGLGHLGFARTKFKHYGASEDQIVEFAIITYQRNRRSKVTGKLDDEMRSDMKKFGCANRDVFDDINRMEPARVDYVFVLERTGCFKFEDGGSVLRMLESAVKEYQDKFGIEVTGELDEETTSHMRTAHPWIGHRNEGYYIHG